MTGVEIEGGDPIVDVQYFWEVCNELFPGNSNFNFQNNIYRCIHKDRMKQR